MARSKPISWWLDHLEGVKQTSSGWLARCPAHDDEVQSLSIQEEKGDVLVNCFAGCSYPEILESLQNPSQVRITQKAHLRTTTKPRGTTGEWWERYTGIPQGSWESWGVRFSSTDVEFTWNGSPVVKSRRRDTKNFKWTPPGAPIPPLWPKVPDQIGREIWITEGESDCGVLRSLGLEAYAVTRGAGSRLTSAVWETLRSRGAETIYFVYDADPGGQSAVDHALEVPRPLKPVVLDITSLVDPLLGEKDLRDLWLKAPDPGTLLQALQGLATSHRAQRTHQKSLKVRLDEFLLQPVPPSRWLADRIWLEKAIGMIVGSPKMGKSWLALDLAVSVATGTPFLGVYPVENPGAVVLVTKEDPDFLLQDRLEKILIAKGLGGTIDFPKVSLPQQGQIPIYLDLTREFYFVPEEIETLMAWLREIQQVEGRIALVIFDPVLKMLSGTDEYKASEVGGAVFDTASKIQTEFDSGVVLVHHRSKGAGGVQKGFYGSIAFHAFSENTLYVQGDEPSQEGWVDIIGEYKSWWPTSWAFRFVDLDETYQVEVSEETSGKIPLATVSEKVLEVLQAISPDSLTVEELIEATDFKPWVIRAALQTLEDQGRLVRSQIQNGSKGRPQDAWEIP